MSLPMNLRTDILARFMDESELKDLEENYESHKRTTCFFSDKPLPKVYYTWLDRRLAGERVAVIAREEGKKYNFVLNAVKAAALRRLLDGEE